MRLSQGRRSQIVAKNNKNNKKKEKEKKCSLCGGCGWYWESSIISGEWKQWKQTCEDCNGSGKAK
jgi:DnaJ-class molecular chaperone